MMIILLLFSFNVWANQVELYQRVSQEVRCLIQESYEDPAFCVKDSQPHSALVSKQAPESHPSQLKPQAQWGGALVQALSQGKDHRFYSNLGGRVWLQQNHFLVEITLLPWSITNQKLVEWQLGASYLLKMYQTTQNHIDFQVGTNLRAEKLVVHALSLGAGIRWKRQNWVFGGQWLKSVGFFAPLAINYGNRLIKSPQLLLSVGFAFQ